MLPYRALALQHRAHWPWLRRAILILSAFFVRRNYAIFVKKIQRNHIVKSLSKALFALYLLILLWLVLFKFAFNLSLLLDYQARSINLIPFAGSSIVNLREILYNCVVFIPFGLLLSVNLKKTNFWLKLACICVFSLAAEIAQFVFAIGISDITDLITNTFGGFLGLILYNLCNKYIHSEKLDRFSRHTSPDGKPAHGTRVS
jgi:glycopeptide antibiotics resistance protein